MQFQIHSKIAHCRGISESNISSRLTELVGELLTQDGHRGADALEDGGGEGGADGQAVDEVVQAVAKRDHPGQRAYIGVRRPLQPVAAAAAAGRASRVIRALGVLGGNH